jgi:predicted cytidylate kinase
MIVVIGGPPGSGKTTVATRYAEEGGARLISAGSLFRTMAKERGVDLTAFGAAAEADHALDRGLDERVGGEVEAAHRRGEDVVVDGRIQAYLLPRRGVPCFRVYVDAPLAVRAKRVAGREGTTAEAARREIVARERSERRRYEAIYGIDVRDTSVYDLVIDTADKTPADVVALIRARAAP